MINGKDQEIITINKTGNSILNNAKYSADNTDECSLHILSLVRRISDSFACWNGTFCSQRS